jgi:hypothetical protein
MYGRLLDKLYSSERPLPLDKRILYAMVRANTKEDQDAVNSVLKQFFIKCSQGYTNNRAKKEINRSLQISNVRSKAGKQRTKKQANAEQMLSKLVTPDSRLQTPPPEPPLPSAKVEVGSSRVAFTELEKHARAFFQIFWMPYPNKIDEDGTFRIWLALSPIDQEKAAESIAAWVSCEQWQEHRYVPYPKRFLKERMWEAVPPQNGGSNGTRQPSKADERRRRGQEISEVVFGRTSGLVGALSASLERRSISGVSDDISGNTKRLEASNSSQGVHSSDEDVQVSSDTGGSDRSRKH